MNEKEKKHISKFLSLVLRHQPETISIHLDENGWTDVETLIHQAALHGVRFTKEELDEVVTTNDKQRFAFDDTHTRIRASQGHSVHVDLALTPAIPPDVLYHGTGRQLLPLIREQGLLKMERQHVHLSIGAAGRQAKRRRGNIDDTGRPDACGRHYVLPL